MAAFGKANTFAGCVVATCRPTANVKVRTLLSFTPRVHFHDNTALALALTLTVHAIHAFGVCVRTRKSDHETSNVYKPSEPSGP